MILKSLVLKNYRRFKQLNLDFEENVTAFIGPNGSGKTTIFEAILYALFGTKMLRTAKENVKADFSNQKQACQVQLTFNLENKEYRIERSIKGKNSDSSAFVFTPEKGDQPIAERENGVNQFIKKLLGMDPTTFKISVFSAQKELNKFSSLRPEERKKEIRKLLKINIIKEAITLLRRDLRDNQKKIETLQSRQKDTKEIKNNIIQFRTSLSNQKSALKELSANSKIIKLNFKRQKDKLKKLEDLGQKARQIDKKINGFNSDFNHIKEDADKTEAKITTLLKNQNDLKKLIHFKQEFQKIKSAKNNFSQNSLSQELEDLKKNKENINLKINGQKIILARIKQEGVSFNNELNKTKIKLEKIKKLGPSSPCPTCARPLANHYQLLLEKYNREIQTKSLEIKNKRRDYKKIVQTINEFEQEKQMINQKIVLVEKKIKIKQQELEKKFNFLEKQNEEIIRLESKIKELTKAKQDKKEFLIKQQLVQTKLAVLEKKRQSLNFNEQKFSQERKKQEQIQTEKEAINKQLTETKAGLKVIEINLKNSQEKLKEQISLKKEIKKVNQKNKNLAKLEPLLQDFEKDLLVRIRPILERETSQLLQIVSQNKYSQIELDSDYQIQVYDKGQKYKIERFSGGEEDLINLCLRLAISRVIAEKSGSKRINFLILDEIFSSQDENRQSNIIKALQALSTQFRQLFLITHLDNIKDKMPVVYQVSEVNKNESRIKLL